MTLYPKHIPTIEECRKGGRAKTLKKSLAVRFNNFKHGKYANPQTVASALELLGRLSEVQETLYRDVKNAIARSNGEPLPNQTHARLLAYANLCGSVYQLCYGHMPPLQTDCDNCQYKNQENPTQKIYAEFRAKLAAFDAEGNQKPIGEILCELKKSEEIEVQA